MLLSLPGGRGRTVAATRVGLGGVALLALPWLGASCGWKSGLSGGDVSPAAGGGGGRAVPSDETGGAGGAAAGGAPSGGAPQCESDLDCSDPICGLLRCDAGQCVGRELGVCDDGDPCTVDLCEAGVGCVSRREGPDDDDDGAPGSGAPEGCPVDCDDGDASVSPLAAELDCNARDDDCDGVVDPGALWSPEATELFPAAAGAIQSTPAGLANFGDELAITWSRRDPPWRSAFSTWSPAEGFGDDVLLSNVEGDALAGPIVWDGQVFGTTWSDRRNDDYEVFFNLVDFGGRKLGPDVRLSNRDGFSIHPVLARVSDGWVVVWDDRDGSFGSPELFGQRLDEDGAPVGEPLVLASPGSPIESPDLALLERPTDPADAVALRPLLVAAVGGADADDRALFVGRFDETLAPLGELVSIAAGGVVTPSVAQCGRGWLVIWTTRVDSVPGRQVLAARVDELGAVSGPVVVADHDFVRSASLLVRPDAELESGRALVFYAASDDGGAYRIWSQELGCSLDVAGVPSPAFGDGVVDVWGTAAAFTSDGDVVVTHLRQESTGAQAALTRLACVPAALQ